MDEPTLNPFLLGRQGVGKFNGIRHGGQHRRETSAQRETTGVTAAVLIDDDDLGVVSVVDVLDDAALYCRAAKEASELGRFEGAVQLALRP